MPHVIVIAGPNGSGKTTTAPVLLQDAVHIDNFVNADVIAQGLCAFQPEKAAIQAGRIMLDRIHSLAEEGENFAFETTLASRTFAPWIKELKKKNYQFHLMFLWLETDDLAISRVKERVKLGGHSVPESTIRRRYHAGIKNFFNLYKPISDSWQLYDNSDTDCLSLVASEIKNHHVSIKKENIWEKILEVHCGE